MHVGVAKKGGDEAVVYDLRACLFNRKDKDCNIAITDLSNAFNCVARLASAPRPQSRRVMPSTVPWVDYCYDATSRLASGDRELKSVRGGFQQGDPVHEEMLKARQTD